MDEKKKKRLIRIAIQTGIAVLGILTGANLPDGIGITLCKAFGFC